MNAAQLTADGLKPSKLYTCPHCDASFYGRNMAAGGVFPNHRWLAQLCPGSQQQPAKDEGPCR